MADSDRAAQFEELRFAKKQQWAVATAAVTLLAAIYAISKGLKDAEKAVLTVFVTLIATFGIYFLCQLQVHLERTRLYLDPNDRNPWFRGVDILLVLAGVIAISALVVFYSIWFH
jgi:uncharacterized membrane protein YozB (DUF420 family)